MPSPREACAQEVLETCCAGDLNDAYGADMGKRTDQKGKSYWSVTFCKARVLDGEVRVYSEKFMMVRWQTAYRDLPHKGSHVCRSLGETKRFLQQNFVR